MCVFYKSLFSSSASLALGSTTVNGTSYSANLSTSTLTVSGTLSLLLSDACTIELCDVLLCYDFRCCCSRVRCLQKKEVMINY